MGEGEGNRGGRKSKGVKKLRRETEKKLLWSMMEELITHREMDVQDEEVKEEWKEKGEGGEGRKDE